MEAERHAIDLSVVIVSWNVRDLLRACLRSVLGSLAGSDLLAEIIVVDNGSGDGTPEMIQSEYPAVTLIASPDNLGFAKANNLAIRQSAGQYILLLNPDAEVVGDAIPALVAFLRQHREVGVVGPMLLNGDGTVQSSRRRFPTVPLGFIESTILQRYVPGARMLLRYYCEDRPLNEVQDVDWLVGACLLVRREAIEMVGLLDEQFFMYLEEVDWCYRLRQAGWKIVFLPEAKVIHYYGQSSEKNLISRHIYFNDSKCKFYRKYHGRLLAAALRCFLLGTFLFQIGDEGLKYALGHKRSLRRERLTILMKVVRSGLKA